MCRVATGSGCVHAGSVVEHDRDQAADPAVDRAVDRVGVEGCVPRLGRAGGVGGDGSAGAAGSRRWVPPAEEGEGPEEGEVWLPV